MTQYNQPQYGQPQYMPAPVQPTNGLAIAALITGILGMAVIPIILGIIARKQIKEQGGQGDGLAIAGIVLGALETLGYLLLIVLAVIAAATYQMP